MVATALRVSSTQEYLLSNALCDSVQAGQVPQAWMILGMLITVAGSLANS